MLLIAKGCHDYGGGYRDSKEAEIFHHGISTVITALSNALHNPDDTQVRALERFGRQELLTEGAKP